MEKPARKKSPVVPRRNQGSEQQSRGSGGGEELYASVDRSKKAAKSSDRSSADANRRSASGDRLDAVGKPPRKRSPVAPGREKRPLSESDPALMGARAKEVQQAAAEVPGPVGPQPVPSSRRKSERSKGTGDMDDVASQKFYAAFHGSIDDGYRLDDPYDSPEFEAGKQVADDLAFDTLDSGIGTQNRPRSDRARDFEYEEDTADTEEVSTEDYDATDSSGVKKSVSFSARDQQFKLRPEPEVKTLPGTSLFSFAPSATHKQPTPDHVASEPYQVSAPPSVVAAASHRVPQRPQRDQSLSGERADLQQAITKHQRQEQEKLKSLAEQLHRQQQQQREEQQKQQQQQAQTSQLNQQQSQPLPLQEQQQTQPGRSLQQPQQSTQFFAQDEPPPPPAQNQFSSLQYPPKRQQAANPMLPIPPAADPRRGASVDRVPKNVTYVNGEPVSTSPKAFFKAMMPKSR